MIDIRHIIQNLYDVIIIISIFYSLSVISAKTSNKTIQSRGPWLANGLCCPSGHCLLWPHPSLLYTSAILFSSSSRPLPLDPDQAVYKIFPNLLRLSLTPCHLPYPDSSFRCLLVSSLISNSLRLLRRGSATALLHRLFSCSSCNEAAKFALCYGLVSCLPFTDKGFYYRAFI